MSCITIQLKILGIFTMTKLLVVFDIIQNDFNVKDPHYTPNNTQGKQIDSLLQ